MYWDEFFQIVLMVVIFAMVIVGCFCACEAITNCFDDDSDCADSRVYVEDKTINAKGQLAVRVYSSETESLCSIYYLPAELYYDVPYGIVFDDIDAADAYFDRFVINGSN